MPSKKKKGSQAGGKRKRTSDAVADAGANNATDASVFSYDGSSDSPVPIALFPNGTPAGRSGLFDSGSREGSGRRFLTAATPRVHYIGKLDTGLQHLNPAAEAPQYMVGVVKDGKVTLHDAQLFRMEPSIKAAEGIATVELSLTDRDKIVNARKDLTESFGGKKKKSQAAAEKRYSVDAEALRGSAGLVKQASLQDSKRIKIENESDSDKSKPVPAFDKSATKVENIYPFDKMISPTDMQHLQKYAFTAKLSKSKSSTEAIAKLQASKGSFSTVIAMIESVAQLPNGPNTRKLNATIGYVRLLFELLLAFSGKSKQINLEMASKKLYGASENLVESVLAQFTESETRRVIPKQDGDGDGDDGVEPAAETTEEAYRMTPWLKDKVIATICVLYMSVNAYKPVDTGPIGTDLKMAFARIAEHFRAVGCKVTKLRGEKESNGHAAVLTLPLKFPTKMGRAK